MTIAELRKQITALREEGFPEVYVVDDVAGKFYAPHEHTYRSVHWIVEGELTIIIEGKTETLTSGQRSNVGANILHEVTIGPQGCLYIVAEDHQL